nr:dna replication licensing factor mcm2 [Quercus suber]
MARGEDGGNSEENSVPIPRTSENFTDDDDINIGDKAIVDPEIIRDKLEEDDREDLFHATFLDDYRRMDEQDQYELVGLDDSLEDERDLDQIMQDHRATELELNAREVCVTGRKLPELL